MPVKDFMTELFKKVFDQAMALPEEDRAALAHELWESIGKGYPADDGE